MPFPYEAPRWFLRAADLNVAAGAEILVVPTGLGGIRIWSLCFTFTADAVVGNRTPTLVASDGAAVFWRAAAPVVVAANGVVTYTAFQGAFPNTAANGLVTLSWPQDGLYLRQGDRLATVTAGLDPGDAYSNIVAYVEEYPSGPDYGMEPAAVSRVTPLDVVPWQTG